MTARLRVGIDAWGMGTASLFTGMGQYTAALLRGLATEPEIELVAFGGPDEARPEWLERSVAWHGIGNPRLGRFAALDSRVRLLPRAVADAAVDVLHVPAVHVRPSFPPVPRVACPLVVTMHDAIPLTYYRDTLPARTRAFYNWNLRRTRNATCVLTVSACARREIAQHASIPIDRIRVVASAVEFAPNPDLGAVAALGISDPYFLYAGSYEPRKNLIGTLRAFDRYVAAGGEGDLIALTESESGHAPAVHAVLDELNCRTRVHAVHDVPQADLRALYTGAVAVLFPTFAEGLGLPPIQAVQCGTPVVVSDLGVFEETVGSVAVIVDPTDHDAIATGMRRAVADLGVRGRTRAAAPTMTARFSPQACISDHVAVYRSLGTRRYAAT